MLHGRDGELAEIDARLTAARQGRSSSVLVVGEPGIGKTALLEWACERAAAAGMRVLRTTAYASERDLPYAGLHGLLGPVLELRSAIPEVQARALGTALALEAPAAFDPFAVPAALFSLLGAAAEAGPLLAVVDDLQWLDDGSLRAVTFAARRLDAEGVVLLLAAREGEIEGLDLAGIARLRLGGLSDAAARAV
ncbi:MAG TPA: ATP-binding protein, partial [Solirubrobacteraceae bacterium]|nr:ATP-binding protein [Solirubrobacteraceae bacterium]